MQHGEEKEKKKFHLFCENGAATFVTLISQNVFYKKEKIE